jgi:hypothetical protein
VSPRRAQRDAPVRAGWARRCGGSLRPRPACSFPARHLVRWPQRARRPRPLPKASPPPLSTAPPPRPHPGPTPALQSICGRGAPRSGGKRALSRGRAGGVLRLLRGRRGRAQRRARDPPPQRQRQQPGHRRRRHAGGACGGGSAGGVFGGSCRLRARRYRDGGWRWQQRQHRRCSGCCLASATAAAQCARGELMQQLAEASLGTRG